MAKICTPNNIERIGAKSDRTLSQSRSRIPMPRAAVLTCSAARTVIVGYQNP